MILVSMPFAARDRPSLGLSSLKARLSQRDVACDVAYLDLAFVRCLGEQDYDAILDGLPYAALAGEWVFTECLYGSCAPSPGSYVDDVLRGEWRLGADLAEPLLRARSIAPRFIAESLGAVAWSSYGLVGFTSCGPQNIASLALARRVKEAHPATPIVFGGPNWEGVMGRELHRRFRFVDYACSGEADHSLPALAERLRRPDAEATDIPGVVFRFRGTTRRPSEATPVEDLDAMPIPDHSDYFATLAAAAETSRIAPVVPLEASRGCWWAARRPCRFCGLGGAQRVYRAKSPERVLRELRQLARRWECRRLDLVDNVVPDAFLDQVLPRLVAEPLPVALNLEVRPTVRREHLRLMRELDITIQSGVESLSDGVLRRMRKGTTSLQNIKLLKWCRAYGIEITWNLLYGLPGETPEEYGQMSSLLPSVHFLDPPTAIGPLSLERFSCYFERSRDFGIRHVRPRRAYRHIYPFPDRALRRIAYYFDYDHASGADRPGYVHRLHDEIRAWRRDAGAGDLRVTANAGGRVVLADSRPGATAREVPLDAVDGLLYLACDDGVSEAELAALLRGRLPDARVADSELRGRLSSFVDRGLMVSTGERYLSLALPASARDGPA